MHVCAAYLVALLAQTLDLAIAVNLVVAEDSQLGLLALVLDLLGSVVNLLLPLLGHTTTQAEDEVKGRLLLDVVVAQGAVIFELLSGENETLLIRGDSLLLCCAKRNVVAVSDMPRGEGRGWIMQDVVTYRGSWT